MEMTSPSPAATSVMKIMGWEIGTDCAHSSRVRELWQRLHCRKRICASEIRFRVSSWCGVSVLKDSICSRKVLRFSWKFWCAHGCGGPSRCHFTSGPAMQGKVRQTSKSRSRISTSWENFLVTHSSGQANDENMPGDIVSAQS